MHFVSKILGEREKNRRIDLGTMASTHVSTVVGAPKKMLI